MDTASLTDSVNMVRQMIKGKGMEANLTLKYADFFWVKHFWETLHMENTLGIVDVIYGYKSVCVSPNSSLLI